MKAFRSTLLVAVIALGLVLPAVGFAQDDDGAMTFGEEEAKEVQEGGGEEGGEGGGEEGEGMSFGEEEAKETQQEGQANPVVGVVVPPSKALSSSQRSNLQGELVTQMQKVPNIQLDPSSAVFDALQTRTVETCITEPLCLGAVGEEAGVNYIAMVRVTKEDNGLRIDLDYFQVEERLFEKLRTSEGLGSVGKARKEIKSLVEEMFDLGTRKNPDFAEDDTGAATTIVAISTAVLSAGAIAGGIVFGNQAADAEQKLKNHEKNDNGVYTDLTQTEARSMLEDAQGKAQTANIFYGLAGAFAVTSGILFIVDSGSDVAGEKEEQARGVPTIDITPTAGPDGAGFSARIRF